MALLYCHLHTPDVLLLRGSICGNVYRFPDETIRPHVFGCGDYVTIRRCHHYAARTKKVDASGVERGDGILVLEAAVCTSDPTLTVVSVTQSTVVVDAAPLIGSGITLAGVDEEDKPWHDAGSRTEPLGVLVVQPDAHYMHRFGNPVDPAAFKHSKKRFPADEIARLVAAFEAHVLAGINPEPGR